MAHVTRAIGVNLPPIVALRLDDEAEASGMSIGSLAAAILMRHVEDAVNDRQTDDALLRNIRVDLDAAARAKHESAGRYATTDFHYDFLVDETGRFHRWNGSDYEPMPRSSVTTIAYGVFS